MSEPIENPYAFPKPNTFSPNGEFIYGEDGMSLRDYFAGKSINSVFVTATGTKIDPALIAQGCYAIADAMLAERSKKK